ncbi:cyclic nucleotide-binding domain-containing thioredoxin-disulfide reductase [Conexibacter sp. CPCC 206217]|uniref:FAD-dependent oxidoreductase n=1 Tax=Conexibacter sp. CPCC 206217 TaxID=3064574 RepID=UPI00271DA2BB|nr:cyclic nucleotide-binding domain-containing thioredoxin-disulfide reductase [Conexibacter sp. CPCC 206217]MDO8212656.1 FAD-dependent oxidoreductase [Conexibacter sp. CPCC 206217]
MATTRMTMRTEFPDLADEVLFPRLSDRKLGWLAERGERQVFEPGEVLYEHAVRNAPFYVIERGRVEIVERKPGKDVHVSEADAGTYIGDIAAFTGEPTISACVAIETTEVIAFSREGLRDMVARWPEFGEQIFRTLLARRAWHEAEGHGIMRLIAPRGSRRAHEVRDLLERNLLPVRFYDVDTDEESADFLRWLDIPREETPVLVHAARVMRNPSAAQVARSLGLRADVDDQRFDLVVLGAGPAGLAAAVYGGSEGLRTLVAEAWAPGGQAGTSTRIENYLGFPSGISGVELTRKATLQARRFDAVLSSFHRAVELADGPEGLVRVDLDDGQHVLARTVVMATGARWRELRADGVERFRGAGVYHAAMASDAERCRGEDVIVVGGGNSAGQAAVHLGTRARSVRIVVRGEALKSTMSHYLVDRIERSPQIEVMTRTEVAAVDGTATVESVVLRDRDGAEQRVDATSVFVMIGAEPCTEATTGMLAVDPAGYLLCGSGAAQDAGYLAWPLGDREPHLLETVRPGVFAAGDVRAGAAKRVAGAVGDGALSVRFAHDVLAG